MTVESFRIHVSDEILHDLRERLLRTRFAPGLGATEWQGGMPPAFLRELVGAWANDFDWRAQEERLNSFDQYVAEVNGHRLHFVHLAAAGSAEIRIPILLLHGWPSAFTEYLPLGAQLANPAGFGADARIA